MAMPEKPLRGLRLHDLIGLVIGYGMAALLARSFWPGSKPVEGVPAVALSLAFLWLGLAMSGPILLLLDRRGGESAASPRKSRRPSRPGRLISASEPVVAPVGRGPEGPTVTEPSRYTKAELAWMVIGGYWIGLTIFVVPALSVDTPWALVGLLQVVAALGLWLVVPRRTIPGSLANAWTHSAAVALLWTWPVAWLSLIVLSRSL
jgi:hypothetical protein